MLAYGMDIDPINLPKDKCKPKPEPTLPNDTDEPSMVEIWRERLNEYASNVRELYRTDYNFKFGVQLSGAIAGIVFGIWLLFAWHGTWSISEWRFEYVVSDVEGKCPNQYDYVREILEDAKISNNENAEFEKRCMFERMENSLRAVKP